MSSSSRPVSASNVSAEIAKATERIQDRVREVAANRLRDRIASLHCAEHGQFAEVHATSTDSETQQFKIGGCCEDMNMKIKAEMLAMGAIRNSGPELTD